MMIPKGVLIKSLGVGATVVGMAASLMSDYVAEQKMNQKIEEKVNEKITEALAELNKK